MGSNIKLIEIRPKKNRIQTSPRIQLQLVLIIIKSIKKKKKKAKKFVGQQTSWFRAKIKNNLSSDHSPYPSPLQRRKQGGHCGVRPVLLIAFTLLSQRKIGR